jgi:hypothetical protein
MNPRTARILDMRMQGMTLQAIADAQVPPVDFSTIYGIIKRALKKVVEEQVEAVRWIESARLDELQVCVYRQAAEGDLAALDRVLLLMARRAKLMGLDKPQPADRLHVETVRVEIVESTKRHKLSVG